MICYAIKLGRIGAAALAVAFGVPVFAQPSDAQYELVARSARMALVGQTQKVAIAIRNVPDETRKGSLGGLAAFALLKRESIEAQRIRIVITEIEKAKLLRQDLPLAAIDLAISNSADRQSAAIASRNDLQMAQIATELTQLTALQRGIPVIPNERVVTRMPASQPVVLQPLPVVDRIYQPTDRPTDRPATPINSSPVGGGTVR